MGQFIAKRYKVLLGLQALGGKLMRWACTGKTKGPLFLPLRFLKYTKAEILHAEVNQDFEKPWNNNEIAGLKSACGTQFPHFVMKNYLSLFNFSFSSKAEKEEKKKKKMIQLMLWT
jgi:hypothetical protein